MERRRESCPLKVQQLWDGIKVVRYKRQVATRDRILNYMKKTHHIDQVEAMRQLDYCLRDGLLSIQSKVISKGARAGVVQNMYKLPEERKIEKDGHDWYCFVCHVGGNVIKCASCYRVFHLSCTNERNISAGHDFICHICQRCTDKSLSPNIKKSQLNGLLKNLAGKLKDKLPLVLTDRLVSNSVITERFASKNQVKPSIEVPENYKWILEEKDEWRVEYLLYNPVDLSQMESKAEEGKYDHLEEFLGDVHTIVHNVVIYHGIHSCIADMARLMARDCMADMREILDCWLCYKHSNDKSLRTWFCKPCIPPHKLIYAKPEGGCPYWPAKVIKTMPDSYEVRFFGGSHDKLIVNKSFTRPISIDIHTLQANRTSAWNKACEELKRYEKQLEKVRLETDNFTKSYEEDEVTSNEEESNMESDPKEGISSDEEDKPLINRIQTPPKTNKRKHSPVKKEETRLANDGEKEEYVPKKAKKKRRRERDRNNAAKEESVNGKGMSRDVKKEYDNADEAFDEPVKRACSRMKKKRKKDKASHSKRQGGQSKTKIKKKSLKLTLVRGSSSELFHVPHPNDKHHTRFPVERMPHEMSPLEEPRVERSRIERHNVGRVRHSPKDSEEEVVSSSSCTNMDPSLNDLNAGRYKQAFEKLKCEMVSERDKVVAKLKKEHEREMRDMRRQHSAMLSYAKRKQWCVNCEREAIYHCCWNNSYCCQQCQLAHWVSEHKRNCKRRQAAIAHTSATSTVSAATESPKTDG